MTLIFIGGEQETGISESKVSHKIMGKYYKKVTKRMADSHLTKIENSKLGGK